MAVLEDWAMEIPKILAMVRMKWETTWLSVMLEQNTGQLAKQARK